MFSFATNTLSFPKIWLESFKLYKTTILKVWYLIFLTQIVILTPISIFLAKLYFLVGPIILGVSYFALSFLINLFMIATVLHRMYKSAIDNEYRLIDSIKYVASKYLVIFFPALIIAIVVCVVLLSGIISFTYSSTALNSLLNNLFLTISFISVLVTVFIAILAVFIIPFILFKEAGAFNSIKKSVQLVLGNWWRTFFLMLFPALIIASITRLVKIIGGVFVNHQIMLISYYVIAVLITSFLIVFLKAVILVQFNDLLFRKQQNNQ